MTESTASSATPQPSPAPPPPPPPPERREPRRGSMWSRLAATLITIILLASIAANLYLFTIVKVLTGGGEAVYAEGDAKHRIAILAIEGGINEGMHEFVHQSLKILDRDPPKALVLRINSPGGGVGASDRIYHEIKAFKDEHAVPVVASFGSVAASGGYYVAMAADHIVAEPTCITGSIGVIGQVLTFEKLLKDKLGIEPETFTATTSPDKDVANNLFRTWDERDEQVVTRIMDAAHARFVDVVVTGRAHVNAEAQIRDASQGQVYTTDEALATRLIDEQGYLEAAIMHAKTAAGIPTATDPQVTILRPGRSLTEMIGLRGQTAAAQQIDAQTIRTWLDELSAPRVEYLFTGPR